MATGPPGARAPSPQGRPGAGAGDDPGEVRAVVLRLGQFARSELLARAEREGLSLEALIALGARRLLEARAADRPSLEVPEFRRAAGRAPGEVRTAVDVELPRQDWLALEAEAERQGVLPAALIEHGAMLALAEGARVPHVPARAVTRP